MVKPILAAVAILAQVQGTTPGTTQGQAPGTTPSQCVADLRAFTMQRQQALRTALPPLPQQPTDDQLRTYQTLLSKLSSETTQKRLAMAKECAARFDVKTVAEKELPYLVDLHSEAGQPELAAAGMDRALSLKSLPEAERANILVQAVRLGLREPKGEARNARLEQYVDELDRLSPAVLDQKFSVHQSMNSYYRFDDIDAGIIKHSTWLIETGRTCDPAVRAKYGVALGSAYVNKAEALAGQGMNAEALELLDRGVKDLADLNNASRSIISVQPRYQLVGTPGAAITAPRWLNMPGSATRVDMLGHVTLLEFTAHWCGPCKESYPGIKRMLARYGPQGFRVVLATELYGYFGAERNLTPDQEFERDREYFQKEGMNVPVAVSDRGMENVNGRSVYKPNPNDTAYKVGGIPQIQLIDRKGNIRLIMVGYDDANEARLAKIIEGLLAEK
jgi:thiol-disulfide isomerase/thioredoxin